MPLWYQVSIPSQRRYVRYWESLLSVPRGAGNGSPNVNLPQPCSRELRRIRLYDTVNIDTIFFVISELQEVSSPQFFFTTIFWIPHCAALSSLQWFSVPT